ncbi:MAG: glucosaminidase domain-containing protein [Bacteroidetes bacterium]|nr:glucosaminidase domain-containing protein [Bacteroidota bacterium]
MQHLNRFQTFFVFCILFCLPQIAFAQKNGRIPAQTDVNPHFSEVAHMIADTFGAPYELVLEFISEAKKLERNEGIPATAFIGIAILESTGFTSYLYQNARNPFGMRATPPWHGPTFVMWHEGRDAPFRKYNSPAEAVRDFNRFLESRKWFKDALACPTSDVSCFLAGLSANPERREPGYATDPAWADKIWKLIEKYQLDTL